jgi:hypothetical protein
MALERERSILVSSAVMSFPRERLICNLLDTPDRQDFQRGHLPHPDRGDRAELREEAELHRPQAVRALSPATTCFATEIA